MVGVTVICPNSRRCTVKVAPTTQLRAVLEETCLKEGYDVDSYHLTHRNRPVDMSLPFRLTGFPNNVTFEMEQVSHVEGPSEAEVALQISDGRRKNLKLSINSSLFELLEAFSKEFDCALIGGSDETLVPSCVYMNKQYRGLNVLKAMTLKSMGISGGSRILLRHQLVTLSPTELAAMQVQAEDEINRKRKLLTEFDAKKAENERREQLAQDRDKAYEMELRARQEREILVQQELELQAQVERDLQIQREHEGSQAEASKSSDLKQDTSQNVAAPVSPTSSRLEKLQSLLSKVDNSLNSATEDFLSEQLIDDEGHLHIDNVLDTSEQRTAGFSSEFANFKFPDEPITHLESQQSSASDLSKSDATCYCERAALIFSHSDGAVGNAVSSGASYSDESDDFYELSRSDAQKLQRELREQATSERVLLPKIFIDEKNKQLKMAAFAHTVIRFMLSDGNVIQALFNSREPASHLYEFMIDCLAVKTKKYVLSFGLNQDISNDSSKNLVEIGAAPSSRIYVKFCNVSTGDYEHLFLKEKLKNTGRQEADVVSRNWLATNKEFMPYKPASGSGGNQTLKGNPARQFAALDTQDRPLQGLSAGPLPKWFKKP